MKDTCYDLLPVGLPHVLKEKVFFILLWKLEWPCSRKGIRVWRYACSTWLLGGEFG